MGRDAISVRSCCCCCTWTLCNLGVAIVDALLPRSLVLLLLFLLLHWCCIRDDWAVGKPSEQWHQLGPVQTFPHTHTWLFANASQSTPVRDGHLRDLVTSMMRPPPDRTPSPHVRAQQKQPHLVVRRAAAAAMLVRDNRLASPAARKRSSGNMSSHSGSEQQGVQW